MPFVRDKKIVFDIQKSVISFSFFTDPFEELLVTSLTSEQVRGFFFFPFSLLVIVFPNKNTCYVSNHTCVLYYVWCSGLIENKKHFLHQYLIGFFGKQNEQKDGKTFSHFISFYFTFFTIFKERKSILVIFMVKEQWS